eukprot:CAMPEP_0182428678 /NCGR_PEP_ID=MMETSP1167-20130531/23196_1 /TAXON_ID=2988 /ORGANISM="Mallomonas Sp, Strain CCMP3275" /LENGTH=195 /DNA_ID=CAMNT_0024611705 /DNA_START=219 /DNA_END=806 /DNA_ORIENTATION=+
MTTIALALGCFNTNSIVLADDIPKVSLYTKRSADTQSYADIGRGFKLLRPFGFNEFEGSGTSGYLVKFASLFDVDTNVVVGSAPAAAGKESITDFGSLEDIGAKLAKKRGGELITSSARETEGVVYYMFQFQTPLDLSLPRPGTKSNPPKYGVELYQLCVGRGRLWSVSATATDKTFPKMEDTLRAALLSFQPRL